MVLEALKGAGSNVTRDPFKKRPRAKTTKEITEEMEAKSQGLGLGKGLWLSRLGRFYDPMALI